jgi:hypothetical protein
LRFLGGAGLDGGLSSAGLDQSLVAGDVGCAVAVGQLEGGKRVERGRILDVARLGIEAR